MAASVKDITAKLEQGVKELFDSEKYAEYLRCMSRFHNYSSRNVMLIHAQRPGATRLAGFQAWRKNFNRQVKKGERGIKILAPVPYSETKEFEKLDPATKRPILDGNGQPVMETLMRTGAGFRPVTIFDVSQTQGDPLPELAEPLTGDVERYGLFMDALRAVSPLPIAFENLPPGTDGVCRFGDKIAIRAGMSQAQTVSAAIHEISHSRLHGRELGQENAGDSHRAREVTAESISYCVCQRYKIETGANSFGYVGEWLSGKEMKELHASLDIIRKTASELIESIDENCRALAKERGIDLSAPADGLGAERNYNMPDGAASIGPPKDTEPAQNTELPQDTAPSKETEPPRAEEKPAPDTEAKRTLEHSLYEKFAEDDIARAGGEIQETLDAFAAKHGFGKLSAEFYSDTFTKKEPQSVIIREGAEGHELLRRNLFEFSKGEKMGTAHLSAYFSRLETMKARTVAGHDDMALYGIDVIKARRDYQVRERQTKLGRDTDLPLPAAKNCGIGDIALIYDPGKMNCSHMKVEGLDKKSVVLSDIANGFAKVKLSAERFRSEQGYILIESPEANKPPQSEPPKQTTLDLSLPDPAVTAAEMNEYGYTEPDMYPLSGGRALELFDAGHTIYLLYDDSTEAMALDRDEIATFSSGGLCGITKADWETPPVRDAQDKACEDTIPTHGQIEACLEADLLYGDNPYCRENKYGIYQIKDGIGEARGFRFAPMKELEARGLTVNRDNYALACIGDLPGRVEFLRDKTAALNSLFEKFNTDRPADYTRRSMSVGDVVVLRCNGDITAHFVDSAGFVELPGFAGSGREQTAEKQPGFLQFAKSPPQEARQPPPAKGRPDFLAKLNACRQRAERGIRGDASKTAERGGSRDERDIHG